MASRSSSPDDEATHRSRSPRQGERRRATPSRVSTFSRDIAYSRSPTASRASASVRVGGPPDDLPVTPLGDISTASAGADSRCPRRDRFGARLRSYQVTAVAHFDDLDRGSRKSVEQSPFHQRRISVVAVIGAAPSIGAAATRPRRQGASATGAGIQVAAAERSESQLSPAPRSPATSPTPAAPRLRGPASGPDTHVWTWRDRRESSRHAWSHAR